MTLTAGDEAPNFSLELVAGDSKTVRYDLQEQLAAGPAFVIFAKLSCPTCQWCLPILDRLHRNYRQSEASVVAVLQDGRDEVEGFARESGVEMPLAIDPSPHLASESYRIASVPTSFWIASNGLIEEVIEAFYRVGFEEINGRLARAAGCAAQPLFHANEPIPAFRPG